jgi:hypothetical protein
MTIAGDGLNLLRTLMCFLLMVVVWAISSFYPRNGSLEPCKGRSKARKKLALCELQEPRSFAARFGETG